MKKILLLLLILVSCNNNKRVSDVEEITSSFSCAAYTLDELFFDSKEYLEFPITTVFVKPDSSYTFDVDFNKSENFLDSIYQKAHIDFSYTKTVEIVDTNIVNKVVNYKNYLSLLDQTYGENSLVKVVFPTETLFIQEFEGNKRTGVIHGAALTIGANTYFVREGNFHNGIDAHELGHVFSLLHLFQQPDKSERGFSCNTGDHVIDTPNEILVELSEEEQEVYNSNIMSYSDPLIINSLTEGQSDRVRKHIEITPSKRKIIVRDEQDINYSEYLYQ